MSNRIERLAQASAPYAFEALRVMSALLFLAHGTQKILGFPASASGTYPAAFTLIWTAGMLELVGGALLLAGLFTRPVAFVLSGQMAFAYFMGHASKGFFPTLNGGDASILFCFVFLYLAAAGSGRFSLDAVLRRRALAR